MRGWACDSDNYATPIDVHFYANAPADQGGIFMGATTANVQREVAVGQACGNHRAHGFSWKVPANLRDGVYRPIYAYAINIGAGNINPVLGGSGRPIQCSGSGTATSLYVQPSITDPSTIAQLTVATSQAAPLSPPIIPHNETYLVFWRMQNLTLTAVNYALSAYTGFNTSSPYESYQRGVVNSRPVTTIQWYGRAVGMLNVPSTSPHIGNIMPITLHHTFSPATLQPWPSRQYELSYTVEVKIPFSDTPTGVVNYAQAYMTILDITTNKWFWIGGTIFDSRAFANFPNGVGLETDPNNSSVANPIVNSSLVDGMSYTHMDILSAYASNTIWSTFKTFDVRVSYGELQQAITEIKLLYPTTHGNMSLSPENYRLSGVYFLSEVYHPSTTAPAGTLGLTLRNVKVSRVRNPVAL